MPVNSFDHYPMSWKPDKKALKRPYYYSIAELLEQDIVNGFLAPGTKLPPQRELADFLDLNFTTVTRAYKLCEFKGLIYAITGSGTFVSPNAARSITISADNITNLIDFGFVASFEQTNGNVSELMQKVAEKSYLDKLLNYNDPTGIPHQKTAGLNWMESFGIQADQEHMAIVSGAQNALAIALTALFEPGNRIATDLYTYSNFIELAKMLHVQLVPIPGDQFGMLPDELEKQCCQTKIHGVFLMPSCCNPTTIMISDFRKHELAAVIRKHHLILIEDDIHAFLTAGIISDYQKPMFNLLPDQSVYICSTSKSICSGLRVAYMVYGDAFRQNILQSIFNVNVKTSSLDAEVVTELILSGKAHEIVSQKKQLAQSANEIYSDYFPPSQPGEHPLSFYRWLSIEENVDSSQLEADLKMRGIRVFHSDRFLSGQTVREKYLRIALSSTNSLEELKVGLDILKQYLG
ncbi:GntR family transcriptional regulator [Bacillus glycinifermentans]|uniref:GntR family transcriptional regulator n=1 Tax=Bacillus glycinifermentans TaxID=1664069 RepID=A0A0J6F0T5_9BACI|nr:PLP-dependent aminotransferase family protein [Bacillus glycinifermentans]ATH91874.1 PLP-dependent aminotransferase family protein [Bacillus glycinifermentans]KMM62920.1 GntR family transcriptional regulator [Bacillus glycinifermentans]KRT92898.1 GntR family transcriptional regulator [Bacillus glycinifermentans]MEC0486268.1 PLP-dependent aminotransferase family protein [Bacillus glycinifermentans]MEC0494982.1 PLP-dependent aminotransferase family protein [Bacillus glycinifermentans]